eukprot:scaffold97850_cov66-Phaeocystis_antarctica.AAC.2
MAMGSPCDPTALRLSAGLAAATRCQYVTLHSTVAQPTCRLDCCTAHVSTRLLHSPRVDSTVAQPTCAVTTWFGLRSPDI